MTRLVALAIVLASSAALAQPAAAPQPAPARHCSVTIARAPDDVRAIVESWVQAEPTCTVKLEVRIIPTDGGYYLLARDEYGRVRERVVPDAQGAGVLVASWMAADSHDAQTPYDIRNPAPVATRSEPVGAEQLAPEAGAPGMTPLATVTRPAGRRESRWLSIGGLVAMGDNDGGGVRSEWDAAQRGRFTLGFLASASRSVVSIYAPSSYDSMGTLSTFDGKFLAYAAMTTRSGRWSLRGSLGLGLVYTSASLDVGYSAKSADGVFPTGEVALSVNRDFGDNWALSLGPVLSLYGQNYQVVDTSSGYYARTETRAGDVMMHFALRYRL